MNRYFFLSCILHLLLALGVVLLVGSSSAKSKATYTIDFIGSGKVVSMQAQGKAASPAAQKEAKEIKKDMSQTPPAPKEQKIAKPDKKAYQSKEEISAKKQPKKKKPAPAPAAEPLPGPSILDEAEETKSNASSGPNGEGEFEGGNIQTDFATFPYPWYITQVRNSLWSEWEKRRPAGVVRGAMISFAIARDGKIRDMKVQKSSGDDSFDFAATSAVINAGPFPPLPMLYEKDELTVTVEFKQES